MRAFVPFLGFLALSHITSAAPSSSKVLPKHEDRVLVEREHCENVTLRTDMEMQGQIKSVSLIAVENTNGEKDYCQKDRNWGHLGNKLWIKRPCEQLLVSVCIMKEEEKRIQTESICTKIRLERKSDSVGEVGESMPGPITSFKPLAAALSVCSKAAGNYGYLKSRAFANSGCEGVFEVCYNNLSLGGVNKHPQADIQLSPLDIIEAQTQESIED